MYRTHPSVNATKENCTSSSQFVVEKEAIFKEINLLQSNKSTQNTDILTKCIKDGADIFADLVFLNLDNCIEQSVFPSVVKLTNIVPVHKKHLINLKDGYKPCSVLSYISKGHERFILKQILEYFELFLWKYQCEFRKDSLPSNIFYRCWRNGNIPLIIKK